MKCNIKRYEWENEALQDRVMVSSWNLANCFLASDVIGKENYSVVYDKPFDQSSEN